MEKNLNKKPNPLALLPVLVFLALYLGLGIVFEYIMKIEMGFYNVPIVVAFLAAILVACFQNRNLTFDEKLTVMANGVGDKNIMTMILIFLTAGVFVGIMGRSSASSAAYFLLGVVPPQYAVAILFVVSCFISTAMGTSTGTISVIVPIAVNVSSITGFSMPFCIASVIGGAMFGDNLSFISDTTIAACSTQGCAMRDKFRANFKIAFPASVMTLIIILSLSFGTEINTSIHETYNLVELIPYLLVLVGGLAGLNVFIVLIAGIVSGTVIALAGGHAAPAELLTNAGTGAQGMFETIIVTVLVSALCALIKEHGGFDALLLFIKKTFRGAKGGQLGMGLLVSLMDVASANNTVAIVVTGPFAKKISEAYHIKPMRAASILDTFSCVVQGILPYGAQMLLAVSAAAELGFSVSALSIIPWMFYSFLLAFSSLIYIYAGKKGSSVMKV